MERRPWGASSTTWLWHSARPISKDADRVGSVVVQMPNQEAGCCVW